MNTNHIWVINLTEKDAAENSYVNLALFDAQNKYTKAGLFSGPLRRQTIDASCRDEDVQFVLKQDNYSQIGKNEFCLSTQALSALMLYFKQVSADYIYCRLSDKKLHHVKGFSFDNLYLDQPCSYNIKSGVFSVQRTSTSPVHLSASAPFKTEPIARLYLHQESKAVRGYLCFSYAGIELQANNPLQQIQISPSQTTPRNLQYETAVLQDLCSLGGKQSFRNEVTFSKHTFFTTTIFQLCKTEIQLFWGNERKSISKSSISCSISYDMEWFSVSGSLASDGQTYQLSDLLRGSRGKNYVELNDSIVFLPESLRALNGQSLMHDSIALSSHDLLKISQVADEFQIDPSTYLNKFLDFSDVKYNLNSFLDKKLKSYQREGVQWILNLYKNGFGGCLADDMGLGKTIQAISFICCHNRNVKLPVLIVSPKIVLYNWKNEFEKFAPHLNLSIVHAGYDYTQLQCNALEHVYITTYDTLLNHQDEFSELDFDAVILDEAQYVKNCRTQRYQAIKKIKRYFTLALTGTPIENSIEELWSLSDLLNPGLLGSHGSFMREFGIASEGYGTLQRLKQMITPFFLRRTKEAVLKELPEKTERYIYCEMEREQRSLYEKLLGSIQNEISAKPSRFVIKDNAIILQGLLYLRELCSDPQLLPISLRDGVAPASCKFELFKTYAERIVRASNKLIVFGQFPKTLKRMEAWCLRQGWNTFYIDGGTNHRSEVIEEFERSAQGVFFISLKAGGVGLNLVSCQYVLLYDPWWNSAAEQQAANRIYRIGQNKPVFIYHFLVKDSIEEKIYELQRKKDGVSFELLDGLNQPSKISMDEICKLFF